MSTLTLILQDASLNGPNLNIVNNAQTEAVFNEAAGPNSLSSVQTGDTVTIRGVTYNYTYLGSGDIDGNSNIPAAFIQITSVASGTPTTSLVGQIYAIDLTGEPGDSGYPNLPNGNTKLALSGLDDETEILFPGVPCFVAGTLIQTDRGEVAVEKLVVGDRVLTMDQGYQPIYWIGGRKLSKTELEANPKLIPIRICAGALGSDKPKTDLLVSPQHRMLVKSKIAERMFDNLEVLIPANKLVSIDGIDIDEDAQGVEYFHMLFQGHQIVFANGAPTESLFTGPEALKAIALEARLEIETLFPEITSPGFAPVSARLIPAKGKQMKELARRHQKNKQPLLRDFA